MEVPHARRMREIAWRGTTCARSRRLLPRGRSPSRGARERGGCFRGDVAHHLLLPFAVNRTREFVLREPRRLVRGARRVAARFDEVIERHVPPPAAAER